MDLQAHTRLRPVVHSYISQVELATLLCVSIRTLQNRLSKFPESLPRAIKFPGAKSPVWDPVTVSAWQQAIRTGGSDAARTAVSGGANLIQTEKRKRGRPSNADRFARGELAHG